MSRVIFDFLNRCNFKIRYLFLIVLVIAFLVQCESTDPNPVEEEETKFQVDVPFGKGHDLLSEYNFFKNQINRLDPNTDGGVYPYDLNTQLFSDYASKKRFVYVPKNLNIPINTTDVLELPVGSVLIKHFYYENGDGSEQYVETRLLIHQSSGWVPEIYEWNADKSDAVRTIIGANKSIDFKLDGVDTQINYLIPNQNQCKNCHDSNGRIKPIGPTVANLNKPYSYASSQINQLEYLSNNGVLAQANSSSLPRWPAIEDSAADLDLRARTYLDVNCSSCHSRAGSAENSGLYLEFENQDSLSLGFFKTPVAAGGGSGGFEFAINPGHADSSILLYRMISDETDERMPEIGRSLMHEEGVELIRAWINSL